MKGLLIAAIDVLTLILVVMLLGFFAIRYGSAGSGEKSWVDIKSSLPDDSAFLRNPPATIINAIVIRGNTIEVWPFVGRVMIEEGKLVLRSPEDLIRNIHNKEQYVIYEKDGKKLLGDVIRSMVKANVSNISIAQVSE